MKGFNKILPFVIVAFIFYQFFGSDKPEEEGPALASDIQTYGQIGVKSDWPKIEEGFSQVAENIAVANYYLVLDGSGSMSDSKCSGGRNKIAVAKDSLKAFVSNLPGGSNVGVFAFDQAGIGERLPLGTYSQPKINKVLTEIYAGGGTPLSVAIQAGHAALTTQAKKQLGYGEYHLVVVTDGEANSGYQPDQAVRDLLQSSPIVLHTVGFCISDRHSLNQPGYTLYKSADDPASLAAGLDSVLAEAPDFSVSDFSADDEG